MSAVAGIARSAKTLWNWVIALALLGLLIWLGNTAEAAAPPWLSEAFRWLAYAIIAFATFHALVDATAERVAQRLIGTQVALDSLQREMAALNTRLMHIEFAIRRDPPRD